MIISGGSRSNWRFFARHLMNAKDNERVSVIEFRGVAADTVLEALREMDAVASGTRTTNFFYHADLNPRADEKLTPEQWQRAVQLLGEKLGLDGQPYFVVEHVKNGREHRHVIWSRIDADSMKAISDSRNYARHEAAARALEQEFGHEAVDNCVTRDTDEKRPDRRPENWEVFRGRKSGLSPQEMQAEITALWRESETGAAFEEAMREHGYLLCKGDSRDFCIVDAAGDEHSLARRIKGAKAKDIRARMADMDRDELPSVAEGRAAAKQAKAYAAEAAAKEDSAPDHSAEPEPDAESTQQKKQQPKPPPLPPRTGEELAARVKQFAAAVARGTALVQKADNVRMRLRESMRRLRDFTLSRIRARHQSAPEKTASREWTQRESARKKAPAMER